jgi:outer membrane protein assembly factor BamB
VPGGDAAYVVGSDGFLHALNVQNGADLMPATSFLPPNTRAMGLLIATDAEGGATAYAATTHGCGSQPDAVWAMPLGSEKKPVVAYQTKGATIAGSAGAALGRDGTVYITTAAGSAPFSNALIALEAGTLKLKSSATVANAGFTSSPLVFPALSAGLPASAEATAARRSLGEGGKASAADVVAAAGKGKLYLFDSGAIASGPISTAAVAGSEKFETGALASWLDEKNVRWIAVPSARGVVAFRVVETGGKPSLEPGWTSRDIAAPLSPLVVNGVLFTASRGSRLVPSVLYAIDASNGKDLWSSGRTIAAAVGNGLSAGQGNVYVPGADSTLYAFGFAIEK